MCLKIEITGTVSKVLKYIVLVAFSRSFASTPTVTSFHFLLSPITYRQGPRVYVAHVGLFYLLKDTLVC